MAENGTPEKLAVVLFNTGGPSSPADIRPFLFRFFMDRNIIGVVAPLRCLIAAWTSWRRSCGASRKAYQALGGKSPLLENTRAQASALEKLLKETNPETRVFVSMRYSPPLAEQTVREVAAFRPEKTVLLPLYPQYSTTTSHSSLQSWQHAEKKTSIDLRGVFMCCYPEDPGFIAASSDLIGEALAGAPEKIRVLFSAHGLPEKIIRKGDPYQRQCEQTVAAIVKHLNRPALDWQLCYQSRVGRLKWTGPSVVEALEKAAGDGVGVVIYPVAFVSEHVETLVELDIDCRDRAKHLGVPYFARVPTVGTHPNFIEGLRDIVLSCARGMKKKRWRHG
ncbi:MAG: ferrochelatase [Pseudomonadota bacterium]